MSALDKNQQKCLQICLSLLFRSPSMKILSFLFYVSLGSNVQRLEEEKKEVKKGEERTEEEKVYITTVV